MNILHILVPVSLAAFFIWKARTKRIFLLGIPFLQVMQNSIFFDEIKLFWTPGRLSLPLLILVWVLLAWIFSTGVLSHGKLIQFKWHELFGPSVLLPEEWFLIALFGVWSVNLVLGLINATGFTDMLQTGLNLGCMFFGYLLTRGIVANSNRQDLDDFLTAIVFANAIAGVLYILNQGFNLPIYTGQAYQTINIGGVEFTRTFWWMPRFYFLSIAYSLSRPKWTIYSILILIITLLIAFFAYSRNTIIIFGIIVVFAFSLQSIKQKLATNIFKFSVIPLVGLVFLWGLGQLFPVQLNYLADRFQSISNTQLIGGVNNFTIRLDYFSRTLQIIGKNHLALGLGLAGDIASLDIFHVNQWTADITWIPILYRYGFVGIILFIGLFLLFGLRALKNYLHSPANEKEEGFWLIIFLVIVGTVGESFFSWTIFDPRNYTLALWFFAFIGARSMIKNPKLA